MRFLHLADLHLGKILHKKSLLEDQIYILQQILEIAQSHKVDAVLIAGDVYQRNAPSAEAMTVFSDFLAELARQHLPCYLISGNHDSAARVAYLSQLAALSGVYISGAEQAEIYTYTAQDDFGEIVLHLLPFTAPLHVKARYPDKAEQIVTYDDALRVLLSHHPVDAAKRNVLIAHQYLTGAQICDSEELAIGGQDNVSAALFDAFDYVALGHLHGPQRVSRPAVRYAGSPLKYSFSEQHQRKSVTVVELREKGSVTAETVPLTPLHDLRELTGTFAELMAQPQSEDYMQLIITDDEPPADAARQLRTVFPNLLHTVFRSAKFRETRDVAADVMPEQTDFSALLQEFYAFQNNGAALTDTQNTIVKKLLAALDQEAGDL